MPGPDDYPYVHKNDEPAATLGVTQGPGVRSEASQAELNPAFYTREAKPEALQTEAEKAGANTPMGASLQGIGYADTSAPPAAPDALTSVLPEDTIEAPPGNASRDEWAEYAASQGAPEEETKPVDEGGLTRDALREKYGD